MNIFYICNKTCKSCNQSWVVIWYRTVPTFDA